MTMIDKTSDQPSVARRLASSGARLQTSDVVCGIVALAMLFVLVQLFGRNAFWMDEAMLMTNIVEGTWGDLLGPLPFYDQAAPVVYLLVLKVLHTVFGFSEIVFRLPSWIASAAAVWIVARHLPGLDALERACAALFLVASSVFAYLATETKPYNFEVLFGVVLLTWFQGPASSPRAVWGRLAVLLAAIPAISTFPLLVFAVGAAEHLRGVRHPRDLMGRVLPRVLAGGWIYAVAGLCYVLYYVAHIKPAYQAALGNYSWLYVNYGFAGEAALAPWVTSKLYAIVRSHLDFGWIGLAALALGAVRLRGRASPYGTQAAVLVGLVVCFNLVGLFPLMAGRFSVFLVPWMAVLAGVALAYLLSPLRDRRLQMPAAAVMAGIVLLPALVGIVIPAGQESRRPAAYLATAAARPDTLPVMVTFSAQPLFDIYTKAPAAPGGDRCGAVGVLGYTNRCRALKAPGDGAFLGAATKWYLMSYANGAGMKPVGFPGADPGAYPGLYLDWLVSVLPVGQPVLLYTARIFKEDTDGDLLQARFRQSATVEHILTMDRASTGGRGGQIDRVRRDK